MLLVTGRVFSYGHQESENPSLKGTSRIIWSNLSRGKLGLLSIQQTKSSKAKDWWVQDGFVGVKFGCGVVALGCLQLTGLKRHWISTDLPQSAINCPGIDCVLEMGLDTYPGNSKTSAGFWGVCGRECVGG